jgi:hypothetical protein
MHGGTMTNLAIVTPWVVCPIGPGDLTDEAVTSPLAARAERVIRCGRCGTWGPSRTNQTSTARADSPAAFVRF